MMLTARTVLNTNVATLAHMRAHLARATDLSGNDIEEIATGYYELGAVYGISADGALAQCLHETNNLHFGGQVSASQHNMAGIGATNDGSAGLSWPTWRDGIKAHYIHLLAWCGQPAGDTDPRIRAVKAAIRQSGKVITWRDLSGRWAVPGDGYADAIERHWQAIVNETGAPTVSVPKPAMTILDSPNRDGYGGTRRVDAIVLHITQGTDSRGWLTSPASKASANYLIERDGTIYQLVPPDHDAWANGQVDDPDTSNALIVRWLAERDSQGHPINFNQRTISIEHEGMSSNNNGGSLTDAQVRATVALQAWLCATFTIPPDQDHILGHYQIDDVDRHFCPGFSAAEWREWTDAVAALVHGGPAPAPAPMLAPVVTEREDWGGKGRLISLEVTVVNDDTGKYYSRKKRYTATGIVYDDWREV